MTKTAKKVSKSKVKAPQEPLKKFEKPGPDTPILPSIKSQMDMDLLLTDNGDARVIHNGKLPEIIWWAEFEEELGQLYFVTITGKVMGLGEKIPPAYAEKLKLSKDVTFVEMDGKVITYVKSVALVVRDKEERK